MKDFVRDRGAFLTDEWIYSFRYSEKEIDERKKLGYILQKLIFEKMIPCDQLRFYEALDEIYKWHKENNKMLEQGDSKKKDCCEHCDKRIDILRARIDSVNYDFQKYKEAVNKTFIELAETTRKAINFSLMF